jgi:uncharacterized protein (DUF885 family)
VVVEVHDDQPDRRNRHPVFALSDEMLEGLAALYPITATAVGIKGHDDGWGDLSPLGVDNTQRTLRAWLRRVQALPQGEDQWDRLAIMVATDALEVPIREIDEGLHFRDLNSIACPFQEFREIFEHMPKDTPNGWDNIAARLTALPDALGRYQETLDAGRSRGLTVAVRQVDSVIQQARVSASDQSPTLRVVSQARESDHVDPTLLTKIETATPLALAAFAAFADWLDTTYRRDATAVDAVGEDRYRSASRQFLGTTIDLAETYEWGWSEVDLIRARMETLATTITPDGSLAAALQSLNNDENWGIAPDHATFVAEMQQRLDVALERLDGSYFDVPDTIRSVDVKIAPPGGSLGAYYVGPSEDFSRAGSVWWSFGNEAPVPLWAEVTTAYHEGFPGHHLQVGMQSSFMERLSRIHRLWTWLPGMGEGWALYAETLMDELGYFDNVGIEFGYLASQMLRACRVVIDIGIHLGLSIPGDQPLLGGEPWSFDNAVRYLEQYAGLDADYARSEATRYSGWPGQAIAYKVGERAILEMREELKQRQGDDFDLKEFHHNLLEIGPVGIDTVRSLMLD